MNQAARSGAASSLLAAASHIAILPGLYVVGAVTCLAQIAGLHARVSNHAARIALAFAFTTAMAVYLLDRVKLRNRWLDPADAHAHPRRFAFLKRNAYPLRALIVVLLITAALLGAGLFVEAALAPLIAAAGVLLYAGRPRATRARPKDLLLIKNAFVALGICGFATMLVVAASNPGAPLRDIAQSASANALPLTLAAALLLLRVFADAVLCDLDDAAADRQFGTETIPGALGLTRARNFAIALRLLVAAALAAIPILPLWPRLAWAAVTGISTITLRATAPRRVRDWVDGSLALEAAVVALALTQAPPP